MKMIKYFTMNEKLSTRGSLARNLRYLMRTEELTEAALAKKADVSQKTINNILNEAHSPKLEVVEAIAAVFGLNGWHLIMPNLPDDLIKSDTLSSLVNSFKSASPDGRRVINMIAERESTHKASNK